MPNLVIATNQLKGSFLGIVKEYWYLLALQLSRSNSEGDTWSLDISLGLTISSYQHT